jgi:tetratricopeptide (TPR) repeat protein
MTVKKAFIFLLTFNYGKVYRVAILITILVFGDNRQMVANHMEQGKLFLAKGQFADALHHYHAAIELDPNDYQIHFRRATVLLATGKVKAALPDLDKVVELKPDFIAVSIPSV